MKLSLLLFLICAASLQASLNEPLRAEWFTGYRNDQIHWHLQNETGATLYTEHYRDVQFWENGLVLKTIHRDVAFLARGSYSAFGKGNLSETYRQLSFTPDLVSFQSHTSGWAADAMGYISYGVNLTEGRLYKWIVLPLLGYSAHFERLNRSSPKPKISSAYEMNSSFPQQLRQSWYGVFLGVALQIEPGGRLLFNVGYTYHWLRARFNTQWQEQVVTMSGNNLVLNSIHLNRGGNLGQTGWAQIDYSLTKDWRMGLGAQIHYFSTRFFQVDVKQNNNPVSEVFKLRWTPIDGWIQISREF